MIKEILESDVKSAEFKKVKKSIAYLEKALDPSGKLCKDVSDKIGNDYYSDFMEMWSLMGTVEGIFSNTEEDLEIETTKR